jgi:hypothetical protein
MVRSLVRLLVRALLLWLLLIALGIAAAALIPDGPCGCVDPNPRPATPTAHQEVRTAHQAAWITGTQANGYGASGAMPVWVSPEPIGVAV